VTYAYSYSYTSYG